MPENQWHRPTVELNRHLYRTDGGLEIYFDGYPGFVGPGGVVEFIEDSVKVEQRADGANLLTVTLVVADVDDQTLADDRWFAALLCLQAMSLTEDHDA